MQEKDIVLCWKNLREFLEPLKEIDVEIGTGNGHFIVEMASLYKDRIFIGFEYDWKRFNKVKKKILERGLLNVRIINENAIWYLTTGLFHDKIKNLYVLFPDPWPKKSQSWRRLFNDRFVSLLEKLLKDRGRLYLKTDAFFYIEEAVGYLKRSRLLNPVFESVIVKNYKDSLPKTLFEERFIQQGKDIFFTIWEKGNEKDKDRIRP